MKVSVIIAAAGSSSRMAGMGSKPFLELLGKPVLSWSLAAFDKVEAISEIVVVTRAESFALVQKAADCVALQKPLVITEGGSSRLASVRKGLHAAHSPDYVLVHDAARPCVTPGMISRCLQSAVEKGSGIAARRMIDTVKRASPDGVAAETVDRSSLWTVQTPQAFAFPLLSSAISAVSDDDPSITDEASAVEKCGKNVQLVDIPVINLKITVQEDLWTACLLLGSFIGSSL